MWPVNRARLVLSQSCSWLARVVSRRLSIISFRLSLSSATSPSASTVICWLRSPWVTAVDTSAMARSWVVSVPASWLTFSVSLRQVPETSATSAWPPSLPSVPTSRATRVTSSANDDSWSTIGLTVVLSSRISPRASTYVFWVRSPWATAVVTSAMLRTWLVRLPAIEFTESVRSFQVPATPRTCAWPPRMPSVPTSRATRVTSSANARRVSTIALMVLGERGHLAARLDRDLLAQVAAGHGRGHVGDAAHLVGQVGGHRVHRVGEVAPGAGDTGHPGLAAEHALGADLAGDAGDLVGERRELVDHRVDGALELEDLAAGVDRDLAAQVAAGDGGGDLGDVAHLGGQVGGHQVDVLGEVLPGAGDVVDVGLAAEPALGADLAGDAGDLVGEGRQLVDHRVDGALELEDLAAGLDGDAAGQVAAGDGGGDLGDVAHLGGERARHEVHRVGQVAPGAGHAGHRRLAAEPALAAHLAGHAGDLVGERRELVDHGVDGGLQLGQLAASRRR